VQQLATQKKVLDQEEETRLKVDMINWYTDIGRPIDAAEIQRLKPPHPHHYLAEECFAIQGEFFQQQCTWKKAASAYRNRIACLDAIFGCGYNYENTAFASERLGDVLQNYDHRGAEAAYQRTVRILQVCRGHGTPYSNAAISKLLSVQGKIVLKLSSPAVGHSAPGSSAAACALCGVVASHLKRCGRCNKVHYCSKDHQTSHWKAVHKRQCQQAP